MNAELTTRAVVAQNGDVAVPDTSQPVSINIPEAKWTSATFRIPAAIWCMLVAITSDMIGVYGRCLGRDDWGCDTFWIRPFGYPARCSAWGPYFRFLDPFHDVSP